MKFLGRRKQGKTDLHLNFVREVGRRADFISIKKKFRSKQRKENKTQNSDKKWFEHRHGSKS